MYYFWGGLILWYLIIFVYKTKTGSPSIWSKDSHIKRLMSYIKKGMKVADLGCGDGRVLIEAVKNGASEAEGWEIEPLVYIKALMRISNQRESNKIKIHFADMWGANLERYDLVYVYQLTRYAPRFVKKCKKEMKKGSLVIANTYPLEGLKLIKRDHELFVYML